MDRFVQWVQSWALALGAPGLFIVGFLDSSFFSLPEINDLLLVWMITEHKSRLVVYALSATLGSIGGCLVLYYLGRKGGEALVRRRFDSAAVERAMAVFRRYGVLAILVPSLLPPPSPFKIFVLLAGVAGVSVSRFIVAVALGRSLRYLAEGLLAVWYGDRAIEFLNAHARAASLTAVLFLGLAAAAYIIWHKAQTAERR